MFAMFSIALLATATTNLADAEVSRVAYSNCLTDYTVEQLDLKTSTSAFKKAIKSACETERNAMIAAMTKDELEFGSTQKEASNYALEEADGVAFAFSDGYASYASSNTRPVKE
ncbi:hypothetical protein [Parasphingorhabdus sp.]|uniref:hypothetical protein n=1 Tax=Parasphingorhabdus sp. TaxID=2709688 RepID=UPI003267E11D